ncbi:MAG: diguanylate cyclase [Acidithiobacillus sp.]|nr:diguanylate cyclase [Acidithiobacillus sp.]
MDTTDRAPMILVVHQEAVRRDSILDGYIVVGSAKEALACEVPILGFLLRELDSPILEETAWTLRRSRYWYAPIFTTEPNPHPLLDGQSGQAEAISKAERMQTLLQSLRLDIETLQLDERLLTFLYIRDGGTLQPQFDRNVKTLYHYPVAEALTEKLVMPSKRYEDVLEDLMRRRLLLEQDLVDRVRCCIKCGSAHHNYIDVCPNCTSIAIGRTAAIHCFTCGFVGPEQDFHTAKGLVCPRCGTHLRHIGVDYDKPLTQFACRDCRHVFVEPDVMANCLYCNAHLSPDDLDPREFHTLAISTQGRTALRAGRLDESFAYLDIPQFVLPNYFIRMLDWALAAQQRHPDLGFGLVLLDIGNVPQLFELLGFQSGYALLDEIIKRLGDLLRDSDMVTRTHEYRVWIFLPMSSIDLFIKRLNNVFSELFSKARATPEIRLWGLQAPQDIEAGDDAETIMRKVLELAHVE